MKKCAYKPTRFEMKESPKDTENNETIEESLHGLPLTALSTIPVNEGGQTEHRAIKLFGPLFRRSTSNPDCKSEMLNYKAGSSGSLLAEKLPG